MRLQFFFEWKCPRGVTCEDLTVFISECFGSNSRQKVNIGFLMGALMPTEEKGDGRKGWEQTWTAGPFLEMSFIHWCGIGAWVNDFAYVRHVLHHRAMSSPLHLVLMLWKQISCMCMCVFVCVFVCACICVHAWVHLEMCVHELCEVQKSTSGITPQVSPYFWRQGLSLNVEVLVWIHYLVRIRSLLSLSPHCWDYAVPDFWKYGGWKSQFSSSCLFCKHPRSGAISQPRAGQWLSFPLYVEVVLTKN